MEPEWLTYAEVADRLGVTPEAARSRAKRLGWRRQTGNDGRALVLVALEPRPPGDPPMTPRSPPGRNQVHAQIARLEGELAGVREALVEARARATVAESRLAAADSERAKAIGAFANLANRLDALAAESVQRRPWWRRLAG